MKKIILISTLLITAISPSLFAKKGFGADLTVSLGAGIGFFHGDTNKYPNGGFEFGVYLKPNYYFEFSALSFGLSFEVGYQRDAFAYKNEKLKGDSTFDSLALGFIPKIDVLFLSIGFGGGVKLPLGGNSSFIDVYGGKRLEKYGYSELKENFGNVLIIPYIKASVDFMLLPNIALGIYAAYDIPVMKYPSDNANNIYNQSANTNVTFSSFDIGGQITLRF